MGDQIELVRNGNNNSNSKEITLGTDQDPYNKPELVNTLKGRELGFFVLFYIFAVACIVMAFEFLKPSIFLREESMNVTRYITNED